MCHTAPVTEVSKLWYPLHINQRRQFGYLGITCGFLQVFGTTFFFGGGEEEFLEVYIRY